MLFDCFTFYNEEHLLEYRLDLLKDIVDYFVIVEATHTHAGHPKPKNFDITKFKDIEDRIIYILVDDFPCKNVPLTSQQVWMNEKYQRNCIARAFDTCQPDDYIIISDLDEIPDPETVLKIKNENMLVVGKFIQDLYYCNLESFVSPGWDKSKILKYSYFCSSRMNCDTIRLNPNYVSIPRGGWHLSYFGSAEFIANKIKNFAHQEYNNPEYTDLTLINERISSKKDLFDRNMPILEPNRDYLPPNFKMNLKKE